MSPKNKAKRKSKKSAKEPETKNIKNYAEWFRSMPEMESQIPVAFLDENGKESWHNISSEIRETAINRAGSSIKGAMQKGFLSEIQKMLPIAHDKGGKHLWMESIDILRKRAGLLPTFDYVKTFAEDCQLVANAISVKTSAVRKNRRRRAGSEKLTDQELQAYNLITERGLTFSQAGEQWQPQKCTSQNIQKLFTKAQTKIKNMRSKSIEDYHGKHKKRALPYAAHGQRRLDD